MCLSPMPERPIILVLFRHMYSLFVPPSNRIVLDRISRGKAGSSQAFGWCSGGDDAAVLEGHHPVHALGQCQIVRGHQRGRPCLAASTGQRLKHLV